MVQKVTVIGGSGFVGTNLCRQLAMKQQDFEIIDLKMSNQFPEKCKIADVRDAETLRKTITGDVVVNLAAVHRDDVRDKSEYQSTNVDGADASILYPANPGSIYHMSKCLDQLIFQFYSKNWKLKITDLHQGIVWGINTVETSLDPRLINRFDYDGIYGTVLNRFISQSTNGVPLTVYGEGGQKRAFIHISDTARCIALAIENPPKTNDRVRIFNQVAEVKSVAELARLVSDLFKSEVQFIPNPRKELASNDLDVSNVGLRALGFEPVKLDESLIRDVKIVSELTKKRFNEANVINSPTW